MQLQNRRENARGIKPRFRPSRSIYSAKPQSVTRKVPALILQVWEVQRTLRQIQTEYLQALVGIQTTETALDAAINGGLGNPENPSGNFALRGGAR